MRKYKISIYIFRRDFRLEDNISLIKCLEKSEKVMPIFIFTPEQILDNNYKSDNCVQFMIESLKELNDELIKKKSRLFYFFGENIKIIKKILEEEKEIEAIFTNKDYTPYSKRRDNEIREFCEESRGKVNFESYEDYTLYPIGSIKTTNDTIYNKFTPYFRTAMKKKIKIETIANNKKNYLSGKEKYTHEYQKDMDKFYKYNPDIVVNGGRKEALKILAKLKDFKNYNKERNILHIPTTRLSAYIKFGCISIREVYISIKQKLGIKSDLLKQIYWREFYYNICEFNPNIFSDNLKEKNLKENYNFIPWITLDKANQKEKLMWNAYTSGQTGFPIVDACVRELITTGYLHNRGRLIISSFLVKNMFWHWMDGEKFFAQNLVDFDNPNNNGNWQFIAGSGVDSQPFFRILNPFRQNLRFDKDCIYVKKWVPELKDIPSNHILKWNEYYKKYKNLKYPEPILDYKKTAKNTIEKYKKALYSN